MSLAGSWAISCDHCGNCFTTHQRGAKTVKLTVFPLKFCPHRWVEDVVVAERTHQMWPNIQKYVSSFRAIPKKAPQTASYTTIKEACEDPLTMTKLEFFISVAKPLQPFLLKFQTDAPNGSILGTVIERSLANLDGPLHQERCPGAG